MYVCLSIIKYKVNILHIIFVQQSIKYTHYISEHVENSYLYQKDSPFCVIKKREKGLVLEIAGAG